MKIYERTCPYCRHRISPLVYKEECGEHIPGIHKCKIINIQPVIPNNTNLSAKCNGVCKNGQQCKFKAKYNGYCGHHKVN